MEIGDQVRMNGRYAVAKENQGRIFRVRSRTFFVGREACVLLEGYFGSYPVKGLEVISHTKDGDTGGQRK